MLWMPLVLLYGLLKGTREIAKKKAMQKNSVMEVLVIYTLLSFLFVIPQAPQAGGLELKQYGFIAIKSFSIFLAWICSFRSLKKLPVSLYGVLDLSRILFATFCGLVFLHEVMNPFQITGLVIVCLGLLLLKFKPKFLRKLFKLDEFAENSAEKTEIPQNLEFADESNTNGKSKPSEKNSSKIKQFPENKTTLTESVKTHSTTFYVLLALASCFLNAISGFLDKVLMKDMNSAQLQFWYMLFLIIYYLIYVLVTREKIRASVFKNGWVWLLAIMFVIGDKALFIANGMDNSKITVMTLIKQSGCLVTILGGRYIFKEKGTGYKLFCAAIIIFGIVLGVIK